MASDVEPQSSVAPSPHQEPVGSPALPINKAPRWTVPGTSFGLTEILILVGAAAIFIVGVFVTQTINGPDAYWEIYRGCVQAAAPALPRCADIINNAHEHTHTFSHYSLADAAAEALKAIGIAVAVTVGVVQILDKRSAEKTQELLAQKAQQIGENVFDALFANNHSPDLLEKLKRDILYRPIVRDSLSMTYVLRTLNGKGRLAGQRLTVVEAHVISNFSNIATVAGATARLPLELSLPNPLITELKKRTTLDAVTITRENRPDVTYDPAQLAIANTKLQESLQDDRALEGVVAFASLELAPGETGSFDIRYTMIKEAEDTELLRSFHTTSELSLTVIDSTERDIVIRAKAIHTSPLKWISQDGNVHKWELKEISLPQQGVLIWWKEKPLPISRPKRAKSLPAQPAPGALAN